MKTLIHVKTDPDVKKHAQRIAKSLGLPLSAIINAYLKQLGREQRIHFALPLKPNAKTAKTLKKAREDYKNEKGVSPAFERIEDAITYLHQRP